MVVWRILLLGYSWVGTTPCAEAKLHCCFFWDKSIFGVIAFSDSQSLSISVGCLDDTLASNRSPRVIMIVWCFREYFIQAPVRSYTSAIDILRWYSVVDTIYREERTEQLPCVLWVLILLRILSEALFIFFSISPELIRGFYWLGPRVNLPGLHHDRIQCLSARGWVPIATLSQLLDAFRQFWSVFLSATISVSNGSG